jgi:hypothetical protein
MPQIRRWKALAGIALAAALLSGCGLVSTAVRASSPHPGEVATLTGYAKTSPSDPTGVPTTRAISLSDAAALRHAIEQRNVVGAEQCMENQLLFSLHVVSTADPSLDWSATAVLCPAPGVVDAHGVTHSVSCALLRLAASYLPPGTSGTCADTR